MKTNNKNYKKDMAVCQPITINNMTIKNRMVMPGMGMLFGETDSTVGDRMYHYIKARAKGGVGLIIVEYTAVAPEGKASPLEIGIWDDRFISGLKRLVEVAHQYGAKIGIQLHHAGRGTNSSLTGLPCVAPSALEGTKGEIPKSLTVDEIKGLVKEYGYAAIRAKEAGFDCVEIHGAHGYLLSQFMSPFSNKREDEYGGSIENRMRFSLEVVEEIKRVVGKEFPVTFRISAYDQVEGGRDGSDIVTECKMLEAAGVDVINLSVAMLDSAYMILTGDKVEAGFLTDISAKVKAEVDIPVIVVGKIHVPELAEEVIAEGKADMVALGRALIVDPEFPNKLMDGRFEDIKQCIHCLNGCYSEPVTCTQNPCLGHEKEYQLVATPLAKEVLVVGAGPAGLEAAVVCAQRGHHVTVIEKEAEIGGQIALMKNIPYKEDFQNVIETRKRLADAYEANIILNKEFTMECVKEFKPDTIIFATGAKSILPNFKNTGAKKLYTAFEALKCGEQLKESVAIIGGGSVGVELASYLLSIGKKVSIVEMKGAIASDVPFGNKIWLLDDLKKNNADIYVDTELMSIEEKEISARCNGEIVTIEAEDVIIAVGSEPENQMYAQTKKTYPEIETYVIGDAKRVRKVIHAVTEGTVIGRTV